MSKIKNAFWDVLTNEDDHENGNEQEKTDEQ